MTRRTWGALAVAIAAIALSVACGSVFGLDGYVGQDGGADGTRAGGGGGGGGGGGLDSSVDGGQPCGTVADCPGRTTCKNGQCTDDCSGGLGCNGGCCDGQRCHSGGAGDACGLDGGTCLDCTSSAQGSSCTQQGICGCGSARDCPAGQACNTATSACSTSCAGGATCNGGCCDTSSSTCAPGDAGAACGDLGGACARCVTGQECYSAQCVSIPACGGTALCANGCCAGATSCVAGNNPTACGVGGGDVPCVDCSGCDPGPQCQGGFCGCSSDGDCSADAGCGQRTRCDTGTHQCVQG